MPGFKPQFRTKNFSSKDLKAKNGGIGEFSRRSIVRLGSLAPTSEAFPFSFGKKRIIEVNTVEAIQNSRSKLLMKACFTVAGVPQSDWYEKRNGPLGDYDFIVNGNTQNSILSENLPYPILAKRVFGFKGHGMAKFDNKEQFEEWLGKTNPDGYYFEQYFNGSAEYRIHVSEFGCFMAWRKLRKADTPDDRRWYFNSDHCNWVGEDHELFNKPSNWEQMIEASVNALKAVGLDIGSVDLRCQSPKKESPKFLVIEINSAPSLGEKGVQLYKEEISKIINKKISGNE